MGNTSCTEAAWFAGRCLLHFSRTNRRVPERRIINRGPANSRRFICLVRGCTPMSWLVSPVQSAGVCCYNAAPAARTQSAAFSEEKSLMAFVSRGLMVEWRSTVRL